MLQTADSLQPSSTARPVRESEFLSHDGTRLFYRTWPAIGASPKGAIILLHRGHEHSGRVAHLATELGLDDFAFYAWDARGHGRSPGERGYSPSFAASAHDLDCFVRHVNETSGTSVENIAVIAQSVGAVLATTWVHDYAPPIRALVLASPAFSVKLYVPFAKEGIALWEKLKGTFFVNSYVKARFLTHDPERIASFESDPLISRAIASNILVQLYEAAARVVDDARAITVPTQLLISGSDWVVRRSPQHRFYENLGSRIKERHMLAGFYHDTLGEKDRAIALAEVRRFIDARFAEPRAPADLRTAHIQGYTKDEADRLASPLDATSPRGIYWALSRLNIRLGALVSEGIKTGVKTGFDSGSTLDYVYENKPRGLGPGGRLIDKVFLEAIGWRGIRQRKLHLQELIDLGLQRLKAAGRSTHMLDIAAGHGRYVLDAIETAAVRPDSVRLQDYSPINVEAGRNSIATRGLGDFVSFGQQDAFDGEGLAAITPAPDLAIVSGLYELFSDNQMIAASLDGIARAVQPGGLLVYTNQPWHPQLEMIARALTSHRGGQAWVMRRRTQEEMDQLVAAAGFRKIEQRIDQWGIFTVSLAERV
ncbi:bifunctional alpha/beta hydrolase/class I SAM-dependent methyltransferase [Rhizobium lentis]|uniref:bifunctional alpha/beta hydrolase/class I SAM-dependent methyltransferase n=1 Tax=Rhizobium lentis TaxID=1138194 RepID=UPI001C82EFA8|nr:bifunctional alpha/beta hydrolase/class I SAM-dependent methyltransferase [Rhizobium lentis]MBX5044632.1 bifunctional alpha/beta hydrolase/class I SAM-dependent methyltransferase [Rhizobium lentis]MBX5053102.1 bifunctional alpha/beta hydrolase/class I SAM-dependent methyltransferase [Rhizobium lentis]MBX5069764.1 bifunctional alpha/beta hydrolase/class I SAM-dependent methyltransferase [Rhizobium lentis]MBX5108029.1 bifunctional alpha/beta hydrolase/class I SAM-dependent methyltransferase [R